MERSPIFFVQTDGKIAHQLELELKISAIDSVYVQVAPEMLVSVLQRGRQTGEVPSIMHMLDLLL